MTASDLDRVLLATGFLFGTGDADGLRRKAKVGEAHLEPAFSEAGGLAADAVYVAPDGPMLVVKTIAEGETRAGSDELHELAWNLGLAPLLWVVTPRDVRVYDAYRGLGDQTAREPIGVYRIDVESQLAELDAFCGRLALDTGAFWSSPLAVSIDRAGKVDRVLLNEISALENALLLASGPDAVASDDTRLVCQELVLGTLFAAYLLDRGVAGPLMPEWLPRDLGEILSSEGLTDALFEWLHVTFNGDVFPGGLKGQIGAPRRKLLCGFVTNETLNKRHAGQLRLFRFRFAAIPIELVSSVYEAFARRSAGGEAKVQGLHYTPVELVHMALDPAFDGLSGEAAVLDPACGSGLFLVESLRRLVWRRCGDGPRLRSVVRDILYGQLRGVDINRSALRIAAFSLYLASLELETPGGDDLSPQFSALIGNVLLEGDFLSAEIQQHLATQPIDVVVGNPPWTHRSGQGGDRTNKTGPRRSPDQAFLLAALELVGSAGRISLYLKATPLFSRDRFAVQSRNTIVSSFERLAFVDLSQLRSVGLFPGAKAPALLVCANCGVLPDPDHMLLASVPWSPEFERSGAISLSLADSHVVRKDQVLAAPSYLKAMTLGTARDAAVMARIERDCREFSDLLDELEIPAKKRRGQGFQVDGKDPKEIDAEIAKLPSLVADDYTPIRIFTAELKSLHSKGHKTLHRQRTREIYKAPILLCPKSAHRKALEQGRFSAAVAYEDLVFSEGLYGISFYERDPRIATVLCAILNSAVPGFQFLFGAGALGLERPTLGPIELMNLRIPAFKIDDALMAKATTALARAPIDGCEALDDFACKLYGLSGPDRLLVRDTVSRARPMFIDTRQSYEASATPARQDQLVSYADAVCRAVNGFLRFSSPRRRLVAEVGASIGDGWRPLEQFAAVRFRISGEAVEPHLLNRNEAMTLMEGAFSRLSRSPAPYLKENRSVRIYGKADATFIKPAQARYWNVASGFEDGDAILADHWLQGR